MSDTKLSNLIKSAHIHVGHTKIKYDRNDLFLLYFDNDVNVAGVYSKSSIVSPTIDWCRVITNNGKARAVIVNSGNANTMTGQHGIDAVPVIAKSFADAINCLPSQILVNSTGVIGEPIPYNKIINTIPNALINESGIEQAAQAIMTTDLKSKISQQKCKIGNAEINLVAFAKGSGMCAPNMATMLCYIITDADISADILDQLLRDSVDKSLNCVSVDSDCSTNDSALFFAAGSVKHEQINDYNSQLLNDFKIALDDVMIDIAKQIAADGEGATKLIEINVTNTKTIDDAKKIARSIADSPLVKTAIYGNDPNWGRIAMAIGKTTLPVNLTKLTIAIGGYEVYENDKNQMDATKEHQLINYLSANKNIILDINIGFENPENKASFYSSDLSPDYIKINTEYRT